MLCERHQHELIEETDLVITDIGRNQFAIMAALRAPLNMTPGGAAEIVRRGAPIVVVEDLTASFWGQSQALEEHLKLCGATTERWTRSYCGAWNLRGVVA